MKQSQHNSTESGFVALFSVIFFALLATVITIGFIRIMNVEQRQALNNDLTARALAAAEAGVEDAKRAIDYYAKTATPVEKPTLRAAFAASGSQCNALFSPTSPFVTSNVINAGGQITAGQNLSYTCLSVNLNTADYISTVAANQSQVIPLRADGTFDRVKLEWHLNSATADANGDGTPSNYQLVDGTLPTVGEFGSAGNQPPAYIRAQLIGVPSSGAISRNAMEDRSRTVFLMPFESGGNTLSFQTADTPGNSTSNYGFGTSKTLFPTNCQSGVGVQIGQYACEVTMTLPGGTLSPATNDYYLQVTPLYRDTHIRASLFESGVARNFSEVQPRIDSNGVAEDTYRRVEVRTNFPGDDLIMPRYGAEVGSNVCKNFYVTSTSAGWKPNECS